MAHSPLIGALEAGGTKMVCAVGYSDGTIVERVSFPTTTPQETLDLIVPWFAQRSIEALGIGAFGPTAVNPADKNFGHILETTKTPWRYFDLLGNLAQPLGVPCGYDTDVNAACLGEATYGCARGLNDVVYLTVGTGVGAGVMLGGKLVHGMLHPEAGHILVTRDPQDTMPAHESGCPYHKDCLEGLIAGPAIQKRWGYKLSNEPSSEVDLLAGYLAQALSTYIMCYSPKKIIVGGGVSDAVPIVELARPKVKALLNGYLVTPELADMDSYIVSNSLKGNQGIMGCLALGFDALNA